MDLDNAIDDEITSINSIYGDDTLQVVSQIPTIANLRLPTLSTVVLRVEFPQDYPNVPPSIPGTETVGETASKGFGARIVDLARDVLTRVYQPGEVCIFDFLEEIAAVLEAEEGVENALQLDHEPDVGTAQPASTTNRSHDLGPEPPWVLAEPIAEKKSVFLARSAPVSSPTEAKQFVKHLIATDRKAAKATHNITAWRIRGENGATYQDCDDDGETAAGGRMLHLMQLMDVWDVMVVVTRWYGGIHLGPDRFRIINQAARAALIAGEFTEDGGTAPKKSSKK